MQEILSLLTAVLPTLCSTAILALAAFMYRQLKQLAGTKKAIKNLLKADILDLTKECRNKGYCTAHRFTSAERVSPSRTGYVFEPSEKLRAKAILVLLEIRQFLRGAHLV